MSRRWRVRRVLKWGGLFLCGLLIALFVLSLRYHVEFFVRNHGVALRWGAVQYIVEYAARTRDVPRFDFQVRRVTYWDLRPSSPRTKSPQPLSGALAILPCSGIYYLPWPPRYEDVWNVPLWMPFVGIGLLTLMLWWRDRRYTRPGICRDCGYDLTGNVSGICPECGRELPDREHAVTVAHQTGPE